MLSLALLHASSSVLVCKNLENVIFFGDIVSCVFQQVFPEQKSEISDDVHDIS
jgi:hypothetical protein